MQIVVFDDEKFFCNQIETFLNEFFESKYPSLSYNVHAFTEEYKLITHISHNYFNIVFLDIHTPENENSGIEIAKFIRRGNPDCHIVFITSKNDKIANALDGLIRPSQFLIKPFSKSMANELMIEIVNQVVNYKSNILLKFGRKSFLINPDNVYYFRKEGRKTLVIANDRIIEVGDPLENIVKLLDSHFLYIEKGVVVNLKRIREVDFINRRILLSNFDELFFSRSARPIIKDYIKNSNLCIKMTD